MKTIPTLRVLWRQCQDEARHLARMRLRPTDPMLVAIQEKAWCEALDRYWRAIEQHIDRWPAAWP